MDKLDSDKAVIQITHVLPYFTEEELLERTSKFEREHSLSKFIFEVPFTPSGGARGDIRDQFMRKTQLTSEHTVLTDLYCCVASTCFLVCKKLESQCVYLSLKTMDLYAMF